MKGMFLILIIFITSNSFASREVGNGGDAFEIGRATIVWDTIEYGSPFDPTNEEAFKVIDKKLSELAKKIPYTVGLIKKQFNENLWYFVETPLKEIGNEGATPLQLTYDKVQVAVHKDGRIFIRKDIWEKLSLQSQAYLLLHENLWGVNHDANSWVNTDDIRAQVGILLNPYVSKMTNESLRTKLYDLSEISYGLRIAPNKALATPLQRYLFLDAGKILFVHRYDGYFKHEDRAIDYNKINKYEISFVSNEHLYTGCDLKASNETQDGYDINFNGKKNGELVTFLTVPMQKNTDRITITRDLFSKFN